MHVALATQEALPEWEVDDDALHTALLRRGATLSMPAWTDPTVDWARFDAVLLRTTWDYAHQRERFVQWADRVATVTRLHNPAAVVRWNTDKRYLRELGRRGVPTLPSVWFEPGERADVAAILRERGWSRAFLKPVFGQTARETLRFDASTAASGQHHLDRMLRTEPMILQPYVATVEDAGEVSAVVIDGEVTHAVVKRPVPGDYRVQDDHGGTDAPAELAADELAAVGAVLAALDTPSLLYARVDLLRHEGRAAVIEVEAVEPSLFFRHGRHAADRLADALLARADQA